MDVSADEYLLDEFAKSLDLNPNRFGLLGVLLGNHILTPEDLEEFHKKLVPEVKNLKQKSNIDRVIKAVVNYIRALPKSDDLDRLAVDLFGSVSDSR